VAIELLSSIIALPSSTRQIQAALDLKQNLVMRSNGTPLMMVNATVPEAYSTALGMPLLEITDRYQVAKEERSLLEDERDTVARAVHLLNRLQLGLLGADVSFNPEDTQKAVTILLDGFTNRHGGVAGQRVKEMLANSLSNPNSWKERNTATMLKRATDGGANAALSLNVTQQRILEGRGK